MSLRENLTAIGLTLPEDFDVDLDAWAAKLTDKPMTKTAALVGGKFAGVLSDGARGAIRR